MKNSYSPTLHQPRSQPKDKQQRKHRKHCSASLKNPSTRGRSKACTLRASPSALCMCTYTIAAQYGALSSLFFRSPAAAEERSTEKGGDPAIGTRVLRITPPPRGSRDITCLFPGTVLYIGVAWRVGGKWCSERDNTVALLCFFFFLFSRWVGGRFGLIKLRRIAGCCFSPSGANK